jgi:hypothetical protein
MICFDKYELAEGGSAELDDGMAVSIAAAQPKPVDGPPGVAELWQEMKDVARRQEEGLGSLGRTIDILVTRAVRSIAPIQQKFCTSCRISGHDWESCRYNPNSPQYVGRANEQAQAGRDERGGSPPPVRQRSRSPQGREERPNRVRDVRDVRYGRGGWGRGGRGNGRGWGTRPQGGRGRYDEKCNACGKRGHTANQCRTRCQLCFGKGHDATRCTEWKCQDRKSTGEPQPMRQDVPAAPIAAFGYGPQYDRAGIPPPPPPAPLPPPPAQEPARPDQAAAAGIRQFQSFLRGQN